MVNQTDNAYKNVQGFNFQVPKTFHLALPNLGLVNRNWSQFYFQLTKKKKKKRITNSQVNFMLPVSQEDSRYLYFSIFVMKMLSQII